MIHNNKLQNEEKIMSNRDVNYTSILTHQFAQFCDKNVQLTTLLHIGSRAMLH